MIEQKKLIDLLYTQDIPLEKAKKLNMPDEEVKKISYEEYQRLSDNCKRLFNDSLLNISIQQQRDENASTFNYDDEDEREIFIAALVETGMAFKFSFITDTDYALRRWKYMSPDFIFMDFNMPGMNG